MARKTTNEKVIDGLMNIGTLPTMTERKKRLLALSTRWGRDTIKPSHAVFELRMNAQVRVLESSRLNVASLSNAQKTKLGLKTWLAAGKKAQYQLESVLSSVKAVVGRGGY
jgi:hypothetical protein